MHIDACTLLNYLPLPDIMKPMKRISLLLLLIVAISCNSTKKEESETTQNSEESIPDEVQIQQAIYDELMEVHDEMMPKMEDLMSIKGKLIEKNDALEELGLASDGTVYTEAIETIENADEAMMNWMRNFEPMNDGQPHEEIVEYYTAQKAKMDSVKVVMESALQLGNDLIKEN